MRYDFISEYYIPGLDDPSGKFGLPEVETKGSHIRYVHPDGRKTTIPDHGHKDVPKGLLNKIIRYNLEMNPNQFWSE